MLFHEGEGPQGAETFAGGVRPVPVPGARKGPASGVIWHGKECKATKVRLSTDLRKAEQILWDLQQMQASEPPRLLLNDHCQVCEFRRRCHEQAAPEDNLSLLRGMGEKEVKSCVRKGIFTLTQLAHTFRPRRRASGRFGRRTTATTPCRPGYPRQTPLRLRHARSPHSPIKVYLDIEGVPAEGFVYLIGIVVVEGDTEKRFSFWADSKEQERDIFEQFLAEVNRYEDFRVYCYGGYERAFFKRMRKTATRKRLVDRVLDRLVNVLSVVYLHLYFPSHSNGLKDVAGCLGCSWSEQNASALQSLVWRARWEVGRDGEWKGEVADVHLKDCAALRKVTELLDAIGSNPGPSDKAGLGSNTGHLLPGWRSWIGWGRWPAGEKSTSSTPTSNTSMTVATLITRGNGSTSAPAR